MTKLGSVSWIYQARRVNTQTAANGALTTRLQLAFGQIARVISIRVYGTASATEVCSVRIQDEDGADMAVMAYVAAAASTVVELPSTGANASGSGNIANTVGRIIGSGSFLTSAASVAVQNETLTVAVTLELFNVPTIPTWDTTGSAGTPSLAASTISAANTLTAGRIWT